MALKPSGQLEQEYNQAILDSKGDDFAADNRVLWNDNGKCWYIIEGGADKRRVKSGEVKEWVEKLTAPVVAAPDFELQKTMEGTDAFAIMAEGVQRRNHGHILIGRAWHLHLESDNPDNEAFARELMGRTGLDMPSKSTLSKALVVYRKWYLKLPETLPSGEEIKPIPLEELTKASLYKLYRVADHLDEGNDPNQILADVKSLDEEALVKKYVSTSTKATAGVWKGLPKVRENVYEEFVQLRTQWGKLLGDDQPPISDKQAIDQLINLGKLVYDKYPELLRQLVEPVGNETPEVPRLENGKLNVPELLTFPADVLNAVLATDEVTKEDWGNLGDEELRRLNLARQDVSVDENEEEE